MMRTIWTEGCHWEIAGVIHLMAEQGLSIRPLRPCTVPSPVDVVILACSSAPLLGWGQYLCRMEQLTLRHRCTVIALHPPGMTVIPRTPRTYLRNGKVSPEALYRSLMRILSGLYGEKYRDETTLPEPGQTVLAELPGLSDRFRHAEALLLSRAQKQQCQDLYRERQALTTRAGFRCIHNFRLFITGVSFSYQTGVL